MTEDYTGQGRQEGNDLETAMIAVTEPESSSTSVADNDATTRERAFSDDNRESTEWLEVYRKMRARRATTSEAQQEADKAVARLREKRQMELLNAPSTDDGCDPFQITDSAEVS